MNRLTLAAIFLWHAVPVILGQAAAHEGDPQWAQYTPDERNWMGEASTTERSRPGLAAKGFTFQSCCNHGDRVKAQLRSSKGPTGYEDEWYYFKKGTELTTDTWVRIPNDVIHTEEDAEADAKMKNKMSDQLRTEGVLFIFNGVVTCFWPPEEGG